jgi:exopolyphosphatase/guanosine-5'-triphosphate,3'-diphosphate pyrophosphatase
VPRTDAPPIAWAPSPPSAPAAGLAQDAVTITPRADLVPGSDIGAAIDVGSTSVHFLVAGVAGHQVQALVDESVFLGLGDRVAANGHLGTAAREELIGTLTTYARRARRLGATHVTIVGTEPLRQAADSAALVHGVETWAGVPVHVLTHDEEAKLTMIGVTSGRALDHGILVVDIGGGSSELILAQPGAALQVAGLKLGASKLTRDFVTDDPPTAAELEAVRAEARKVVAAGAPNVTPTEIVAVGGTASNLLRVIGEAATTDGIVTRAGITASLQVLQAIPSAASVIRYALRPTRARILPAGAVILDTILERYAMDLARVSQQGVREGLVIAATTAGFGWRDSLSTLAAGWDGRA